MSNKPKTRVQKFEAWWQENKLNPHMSYRIAWMAGYLAGYRARQYEGDQRGRVQRADHLKRTSCVCGSDGTIYAACVCGGWSMSNARYNCYGAVTDANPAPPTSPATEPRASEKLPEEAEVWSDALLKKELERNALAAENATLRERVADEQKKRDHYQRRMHAAERTRTNELSYVVKACSAVLLGVPNWCDAVRDLRAWATNRKTAAIDAAREP